MVSASKPSEVQMLEVLQQEPPGGYGSGSVTREHKVEVKKTYISPNPEQIPQIYQTLGLIEGLFEYVGGLWCEGGLVLTIKPGENSLVGTIVSYDEDGEVQKYVWQIEALARYVSVALEAEDFDFTFNFHSTCVFENQDPR